MYRPFLPLLLLPFALTACGEGSSIDETLKTTVREQLVATCTASAESQIPESVTVDLDKLCTCAADKLMAGKSAKELVTNPPTSAEDLNKVQECAKEIGPVKIGGPGEQA